MLPLNKDLQQKKNSLQEFIELCQRVLHHLPNVISGSETKGSYKIYSSNIAGILKYVRPINKNLFIEDPVTFQQSIEPFESILQRIRLRDTSFTQKKKDFWIASFIHFNNLLA